MLDATDVWLLFGLVFFAIIGLGIVIGAVIGWLLDRHIR